jgi:hypothetical protein
MMQSMSPIKYILACVAILGLVVACVMPRDLVEFTDIQLEAVDRISVAQQEHQAKVEALLTDNTKTDAEIIEGLSQLSKEREAIVKAIAEETGQSVEELVQVIQDRTKKLADSAGTLTGNALVDILLTVLGAAGASTVATNSIRDKRRLVRGEPVAVQPLTHTAS